MHWMNPLRWIRRMECWMYGCGPIIGFEKGEFEGEWCMHCGARVSNDTQLQKSKRDQ